MGNCGCGHSAGAGPFAEGRELVEFVSQAHGGALRNQALPSGGLPATCAACVRLSDAQEIQFKKDNNAIRNDRAWISANRYALIHFYWN